MSNPTTARHCSKGHPAIPLGHDSRRFDGSGGGRKLDVVTSRGIELLLLSPQHLCLSLQVLALVGELL
jgi:hypothetical protein